MNYYGYRFLEFRNDKILNFAGINSEYSKLEFNNLKYLLKNSRPINIIAVDKKIIFTYEKDIVLKALYGDIELFYTRSFVQNKSLINGFSNAGNDWAFVTAYYFSFFSATTLLRFAYRGAIYFDSTLAKQINDQFELMGSGSSFSTGNYKFLIKNLTLSTLDLEIESTGNTGVHENTWQLVDSLLKEIILKSSEKNSDEYLLLNKLLEINKKEGSTFPSKTRNEVNYQGKYGFESIRNTLKKDFFMDSQEQIFKRIATYDKKNYGKNKLPTDLSYYYGYYINLIVEKLYEDMINRMSGKKDVIDIRKRYMEKICNKTGKSSHQ